MLNILYVGDYRYSLDIIVANAIIVALKSCEQIEPIHKLNYR